MSPEVRFAAQRLAHRLPQLESRWMARDLRLVLDALAQSHMLLAEFVSFERIYDDGASISEDEVQAVAKAARRLLHEGPMEAADCIPEPAR